MVRQIIVGLIWCFVLYFIACMVVGAVAGAIAGNRDPANATAVGAQAGHAAVVAYRAYLFGGALFVAAIGATFGYLPGAKKRTLADPTT